MFDFFVALFGGAYLLGKSAQADRITKRSRRTYDEKMAIRNRVVNHSAVNRLKQQFRQDPEAALETISDDLDYIFSGYDWRKLFDRVLFQPFHMDLFAPYPCIWTIAFHVYLSKSGYAAEVETRIKSYYGYITGICKTENRPLIEPILYRTVTCIARNMQCKYGDDDMYRLWCEKGRCAIWRYGFAIMNENIYAKYYPFTP